MRRSSSARMFARRVKLGSVANSDLDPERLIFINETGASNKMARLRGRARRLCGILEFTGPMVTPAPRRWTEIIACGMWRRMRRRSWLLSRPCPTARWRSCGRTWPNVAWLGSGTL